MQTEKSNWMMVEEYLKHDDRIVFVLGATEEHGFNSLSTDTQTTWEIASRACEQANVLLAPPLHFGPSAFSLAFPGTVSLRNATYYDLITDMLDSVTRVGFKKVLFFSGHGGNMRAKEAITEYLTRRDDGLLLKFREWYLLPKTYARITELGSTAWDHASWLESFPGVNQPVEIPDLYKEQEYLADHYALSPEDLRSAIGDGVFGGRYKQPDYVMSDLIDLAVSELVDFLANGWDRFLKTAPLK